MSRSGADGADGRPGAPLSGSIGQRFGRAALSFVVAWVVTGVAWMLWTQPWRATPTGGSSWVDTFWLMLIVAAFAAIGWIAIVLPVVRFGDHTGWFFHPRTAPLIGFACGVAILLAESALFFDYPPWQVLEDLGDPSTRDLFLWAGAFGGILWWHYTRRSRNRTPPEPGLGPDER